VQAQATAGIETVTLLLHVYDMTLVTQRNFCHMAMMHSADFRLFMCWVKIETTAKIEHHNSHLGYG